MSKEGEHPRYRPLKNYKLKTDFARNWEEKNWRGDRFIVLKNDCEDLQVMFDEKGGPDDIFDIPKIAFGVGQISLEYGFDNEGKQIKFERVFLKHVALTGGEIIIAVGGEASLYTISSGTQPAPYVRDDAAQIAYAAVQVAYTIGTNAFTADPTVPWGATFISKRLQLQPDSNCLVRFNGAARVQHLLFANQNYIFLEEITIIYVVQQAAGGTLNVHIEG